MQNTIEYQYDEVQKVRLVLINGMCIIVDPKDMDYWEEVASLTLAEQDRKGIAAYLSEPHTAPNAGKVISPHIDVERVGKTISLPGARIYRKAAR